MPPTGLRAFCTGFAIRSAADMAGETARNHASGPARWARQDSGRGASIEVRLLGPIEVVVDGETVRLGSSMRRSILALLASEPNREMSVDRLLTALWGEDADSAAAQRLPFHISKLRAILDDDADITHTGRGYIFNIDPGAVDIVRFEQLIKSASEMSDRAGALAALDDAIDLWRGEPFQGVDPDVVGAATIARLEELYLSAVEKRIEAALDVGTAGRLIADLEGLVSQHPYREQLRGLLMRALYLSGRQADALRVFAETRRTLGEELGIEPSPMLQDLEDRILRQDPTLVEGRQPPLPSPPDPARPEHDDLSGRLSVMVVVDLVDSTATRARIGDAQMEKLRRRTDLVLAHAVERRGGEVSAWLGDGCQALFPSATSAIHAAHDMVEWVERDNDRLGRPVRLSVRAAIDAGPMSSLAASTHRLAAEAAPGSVAVSERVTVLSGTWDTRIDLTGGAVVPRPFGRLIPLSSESDAGASQLLGRKADLGQVIAALPDVLEGRGRVASLNGPAGIGKTSLAAAIVSRLVADGFAVLRGQCTERAGRPYQPIVAMLEAWIDHVPEHAIRMGDGREALAILTEKLGGAVGAVSLGDADADRARLNRAIVSWLNEVGASTPTVLLVEDVQWATAATLEALAAVAAATRQTRLLLLTTRRTTPGESDPLDPDLELHLEPLDRTVAELLIAQTNPDLAADAVVLLAERAAGNPLFAVELARHSGSDPTSAVPASLGEAIADRLSALDRTTIDVLRAAAVLGDRFKVRVLREMLDVGDALYDALDAALDAAVIIGPGEGMTYRFGHQMLRSVIYDGIGSAKRVRLHEQAGMAIEDVAGEAAVPAELASHFEAAAALGHGDRAARYCELAGGAAEEAFAMAEAADWYRRGIDLVESDDRLKALLQVGWATAARHIGLEGWSAALPEAARIADRLEDGALLVSVALAGYRGTFTRALRVDDQKVAWLRRALELIPEDDAALLSRVHAELGLELEWSPEAELARGHSDRALEFAKLCDDEMVEATALAHRLWTLYHPTSLREEATDRLLDLTEAEGRPMLSMEAHGAASFTAIRRGDPVAVESHLSHVARNAERIGVPLVRWYLLLRMWPWALAQGRYAEAEQMAEEMYRLGHLTDHPDVEQAQQTHLFWLGFDRRSQEETRAVMQAMVPFARKVQPLVWPSWGHVCADAGLIEETSELYGLVRESLFDVERADQLFLMRLYDLAVIAEALGEADLGERLTGLIEPRVDVHANMTFCSYGSMARAMGLARAAVGDQEQAVRFLEQSVNVNRASGIRAWEARALLDLARFDEPNRSRHLDEATAIGESWDLPWVADKVALVQEG